MTATSSAARAPGRPAAPIPGPSGHPLLGMAPALRRDLLAMLLEGFDRHGDVVAYRVGPARGPLQDRRLVVAVRHPDDMRRVLLETDVFDRQTPSHAVLRELFGETLPTLEGDRWRRRKRLLQPLFTRQHVARYAELIATEAERVVARWGQPGDEPVELVQAMEAYTLHVLGRTIFAEDEKGVDAETAAALERLVPSLGTQVVARVTQLARPPLRWPTPRNRRFRALRAGLHETIERVVARHDRDARSGATGAGDLLSRLRDARDPENGARLTPPEVGGEALMAMLAGHTTTADVMTATLHLLGRHPDVQERVAASAANDGATDGPGDLVRAAVQEAMRLYPPSYALSRRAACATELGGYAVPAGALVLIVPWATHRDPRWWPDPERFDPLRFVGEQQRPPHAYVPFGGGGRVCIGRHLAMLEATILLRALLRDYRLESLDETLPLSQLISMRPERPVRVRFHRRDPAGPAA